MSPIDRTKNGFNHQRLNRFRFRQPKKTLSKGFRTQLNCTCVFYKLEKKIFNCSSSSKKDRSTETVFIIAGNDRKLFLVMKTTDDDDYINYISLNDIYKQL